MLVGDWAAHQSSVEPRQALGGTADNWGGRGRVPDRSRSADSEEPI